MEVPVEEQSSHSRYIDGEVQLPGAIRANSSSTPAETEEARRSGLQKAVEAAGRGCKRLVEGTSSTSSARLDLPVPAAGRGGARVRAATGMGASRFARLHDLGREREETEAATAAPPKPARSASAQPPPQRHPNHHTPPQLSR